MRSRLEKICGTALCLALFASLSGCAVRPRNNEAVAQSTTHSTTQVAAPPAASDPPAIRPTPLPPGQATTSPTPRPQPLVSYIKDGSLWAAREDGSEKRQLVAAPEDKAITHHVWSSDGSRVYFNVGNNLYAYRLREQKVEALAALPAPPTASVDRLEACRDPETLIVRTIDGNNVFGAPPKFYLYAAQTAPRELSVDEYRALVPSQPAVVHSVGEMSVSPDGRAVLFWEVGGTEEQLFVADIETGARLQVTELGLLDGFDPTAEGDGVRRLIEATWSPNGEYIIFIPAQSCSETGLCFGRMYIVSRWGGPPLQLTVDLATNLSADWNCAGTLLVYDDQGQVLVSDTHGQIKPIAEGNQPRWQPIS